MELWYPGADRSQTYAGNGPVDLNNLIVVLHTTETDGPAGYSSGTAPHFEVSMQRPVPRQFVPLDRCSFALENRSGGVETNRAGRIIQL